MEFQEALQQALAKNNGRVSLQQAVDLLHPAIAHRVMEYLSASRKAGICQYTVKRKGDESIIDITAPQPVKPVLGGSN